MEQNELLVVRNLVKSYTIGNGWRNDRAQTVKAVDGVTFDVFSGETFGIVGESGCGKTTLGKCIVRLLDITSGKLLLNTGGETKDLRALDKRESFSMRKKVQMVFQDPYSALNPRLNILSAFDEPLKLHGFGDRQTRREIVAETLKAVNLQPDYMYRFPHEFSGGQRQRICIAKAIAMQPEMIVCDEPVSALDVSIQAQILSLLRRLQRELGLTYIFIAHDLSVVQYMSDRIAVMYLGKIVETAGSRELYDNCLHPYTQALLSAVPVPVFGQKRQRILLKGDVPSPINPPGGCRFHPRCDRCMEICKTEEPALVPVNGAGHCVACHLVGEDAGHPAMASLAVS